MITLFLLEEVIILNIKELQKNQRPRERLIEKGAHALSDVELLAILIGSGTKNENVMELSQRICSMYDFRTLKNLSYQKLIEISGIKSAKACLLQACFELVKRSYSDTARDVVLDTAEKIFYYTQEDFILEEQEVLVIVYVDCKLHPIKKSKIPSQLPASVEVPSRRIISESLGCNAYGIVLLHNHPSTDLTPSRADRESTFYLKRLVEALDILFLDHLIVSKDQYLSFMEKGLLQEEEEYTIPGEDYEKIPEILRTIDPRW